MKYWMALICCIAICLSGALAADKTEFVSQEGVLWFTDGKNLGLKSVQGDVILSPVFTEVSAFYNNLAIVSIDGQKGVIDICGEYILPCTYQDIEMYDDAFIVAGNQTEAGAAASTPKQARSASCQAADRAGAYPEKLSQKNHQRRACRPGWLPRIPFEPVVPFQHRADPPRISAEGAADPGICADHQHESTPADHCRTNRLYRLSPFFQ